MLLIFFMCINVPGYVKSIENEEQFSIGSEIGETLSMLFFCLHGEIFFRLSLAGTQKLRYLHDSLKKNITEKF